MTNDSGTRNGWSAEREWVREDISRLEKKVDELKDEVAEARGKMKVWHALVLMVASAIAGVGLGHVYPSEQGEQIRQLQEGFLNIRKDIDDQRHDIDRILKAVDNR